MFVSGLRLVNFRSYCDATVRFGAGLNVVVGAERHRQDQPARGRLVRAARQLAAHAPRGEAHHLGRALHARRAGAGRPGAGAQQPSRSATRRGRASASAGTASRSRRWTICAARTPGVHLRAREPAAGQGQPGAAARPSGRLRRRARPAVRRRRARPAGRAAPAQRPARGASSTAPSAAALDPWDAQFAARRRRRWAAAAATSSRSSASGFAETAAALAPAGQRFALTLVAQLDGVEYDEAALLRRAARPAPRRGQRGLSLFGPHRDDLRFLEVDAAQARRCRLSASRTPRDAGVVRRLDRRRPVVRPGGAAARRPRPAALRVAGRAARRRAGAAPRGAAPRGGAHRRAGHALPRRRHERARRRAPPSAGAHAGDGRPGHHHDDQPSLLHARTSWRTATVDRAAAGRLAAAGEPRRRRTTAPPAPPELDAL